MSSYIDEKIDVLKKLDEVDVKKCLVDALELANKTIFDLEKTLYFFPLLLVFPFLLLTFQNLLKIFKA